MRPEPAAGHPPRMERPIRHRSGGRSERVRRTVAEAVLAFLREGRTGFTVAEVADKAGVHRTTVYRWWPTRADLIDEALTLHTARLVVPDTGLWQSDVRELAMELAEFFSDPVEIALNATMAGGRDPESDTAQIEHWVPIMQDLATVIERAKQRAEVTPDADASIVLQILVSPLLLHALLFRSAPEPDVVRQLGDAVARAFASNADA